MSIVKMQVEMLAIKRPRREVGCRTLAQRTQSTTMSPIHLKVTDERLRSSVNNCMCGMNMSQGLLNESVTSSENMSPRNKNGKHKLQALCAKCRISKRGTVNWKQHSRHS